MMRNFFKWMIWFSVAVLCGCAAGNQVKQENRIKISVSKDCVYTSKDFWVDRQLEEVFAEYWTLRFAKKTEKLFQLEAPHIRELVNYPRYEMYTENYRNDVAEVRLEKRGYISERLLVLDLSLIVRGTQEEKISIPDRWVFVGGKWYHVIHDPIFFPELM